MAGKIYVDVCVVSTLQGPYHGPTRDVRTMPPYVCGIPCFAREMSVRSPAIKPTNSQQKPQIAIFWAIIWAVIDQSARMGASWDGATSTKLDSNRARLGIHPHDWTVFVRACGRGVSVLACMRPGGYVWVRGWVIG